MTNPLIDRAERYEYQKLFLHDLNWSKPDLPPISIEYDGRSVSADNVSQYKGIRVWVVDEKPDSKLEAEMDRHVGQSSVDRILIFHDGQEQVWRWPVRRIVGNTTTTRLSRHRHRTGEPNPRFAEKLDVIRLPGDASLDSSAVLARVRLAFDVEAHNETKHASKLMARMYAAMEKAYPAGQDAEARDHEISVTLARVLFLMFADDTEMWPHNDIFETFVVDHTAADGTDIGAKLSTLFAYLDTPPDERGEATEDLEGFRYVNGGIFRERLTLPKINAEFRTAILDACDRDWKAISPAILGSMFQSVRDATTRRQLGEHYTSESNILKTLNPLFLDDLWGEFEHIKTLGKYEVDRLTKLRRRLGRIRYLDPACGCGNFVIVAYRELRDLELAIMERLQAITGDQPKLLANYGLEVSLDHFYGIKIDEWPARIAETAMFLIDRQCDLRLTASLGLTPDRLPIQEQATIVVGNATQIDWSEIVEPSDDLVVAGNPPFIGQYSKTDQQTADAKLAWGERYDGYLDYVTSWHAKTIDLLRDTNAVWAFVTTNSITQGQAVPALFRPVFSEGWRIKFAHTTFPWTSDATGKAAVHCVIIGFAKHLDEKPRLFVYEKSDISAREERPSNINAYLLDGQNLLVEKRMKPLPGLPVVKYGSKPADGGHLQVKRLSYDEVYKDPLARNYLRPFIGADELLSGTKRWCLWLTELTDDDARNSQVLKSRIAAVAAMRLKSSKPSTRAAAETAHLFTEVRQPGVPYLAIPSHVTENRRYCTATRFNPDVICGNANFTAEDPDGFLFAIFSSLMFITWQRMIGGRIKSDPRFSNTIVWNNVPLPAPSAAHREALIEAGNAVVAARDLEPQKTLEQHYEPGGMSEELCAAHDALDVLVDRAFGARGLCKSERERQQILFQRYEEVTAPLMAAVRPRRRNRSK